MTQTDWSGYGKPDSQKFRRAVHGLVPDVSRESGQRLLSVIGTGRMGGMPASSSSFDEKVLEEMLGMRSSMLAAGGSAIATAIRTGRHTMHGGHDSGGSGGGPAAGGSGSDGEAGAALSVGALVPSAGLRDCARSG